MLWPGDIAYLSKADTSQAENLSIFQTPTLSNLQLNYLHFLWDIRTQKLMYTCPNTVDIHTDLMEIT